MKKLIAAKKDEEQNNKVRKGMDLSNLKKKTVVVEYEDMTEHQQNIYNAGMDDNNGIMMPPGLSKEERVQWILEHIKNSEKYKNDRK